MGKQKLVLITAVLILLIGAWYYFGGDVEDITTTDDTTSGLRIGANAVYVPDQRPGDNITVGFADIADGGYVVIHEVIEGKLAGIVGSRTFLESGESQNISVTLSRESVEGEELIAMLHNDNGDNIFNATDDAPVRDEAGNIVLMRFTVSENAEAPGAISL